MLSAKENTSLNELFNYNRLVEYYQKNKDRPWNEWLKLDKVFARPGKQGIVGLMVGQDEQGELAYVFKISQHINYLIPHEMTVLYSVTELANFCPHFCRGIGMLECLSDPNNIKNPLNIDNKKHLINKDVLLMEYIENSHKFYNYIKSGLDEKILYSIVKQTLLAVAIAQRTKKFTHYDLHSNNIMIRKCDKNAVFLYILDPDHVYIVPTFGYYPVIIDYGFSYSSSMDDGSMWATFNHTDVGFYMDRFDWVADPKLFLISVSKELKQYRPSKNSKTLRNIVKNLFSCLDVDWSSGWDNYDEKCATDSVIKKLYKYSKGVNIFTEYEYYAFDLLTSLITLPLKNYSHKDIHICYVSFLKEFSKIEKEISNPFYCLYLLKVMIDLCREVREDYSHDQSRSKAIEYFTRTFLTEVDRVASFCQLSTLNFDRLICSLICLGKNLNGLYYNIMQKKMAVKNEYYDKLPVSSVEEIINIINEHIISDYEFNSDTILLVIDSVKGSATEIEIPDYEQANNLGAEYLVGLYVNKITSPDISEIDNLISEESADFYDSEENDNINSIINE